MESGRRIGRSMATLAVVGGIATGFASLLAAVIAVLGNEPTAAGLCFVAAAVAFGSVANATLRS